MSRVCRHRAPEVLEVTTEHGFAIKLDPARLTPLDELLVLMAGRSTFTLYETTGAVHPRPAYKIRERPAGTRPRQHVLAEHECAPDPREATT